MLNVVRDAGGGILSLFVLAPAAYLHATRSSATISAESLPQTTGMKP